MFSDSAGNHRIISDNFIKSTGKIGKCVSTEFHTVPPHLFTLRVFNMKSIQLHASANA